MVIAVYCHRRSREVTRIATGLTAAYTRAAGVRGVALVADDVPRDGIPAGATFHDLALVEPGSIASLVRRLRQEHAVTVLAASRPRTERAFLTLEHADRALLLSDMSVASIRGTQRVLRMAATLGYPYEKLRVVAVGDRDTWAVPPDVAARALDRHVYWTVGAAHDRSASTSLDGLARQLLTMGR